MKKINTVVWVSVYVCVCGKNSIYYLFLELLLICLEMLSTGMENPGLLSYSILLKPIISSMHFHQDWLTLYNFVGAKSWLGSRVVCHDSLGEPHNFFFTNMSPSNVPAQTKLNTAVRLPFHNLFMLTRPVQKITEHSS